MKKNQHHVNETERQKAHAIAQAIGGSKARSARLEITILAVLATFGGTITHTEKASPRGYPATDYTPDPEADPPATLCVTLRAGTLSAQ